MGKYVNPPELVQEIGRRLNASPTESTKRLFALIRPNEYLVLLCDRGVFKLARVANPGYDDSKGVLDLQNQYSRGMLLSIDYYAVPKDKVELG